MGHLESLLGEFPDVPTTIFTSWFSGPVEVQVNMVVGEGVNCRALWRRDFDDTDHNIGDRLLSAFATAVGTALASDSPEASLEALKRAIKHERRLMK